MRGLAWVEAGEGGEPAGGAVGDGGAAWKGLKRKKVHCRNS
jgi:hypothetical protein